MLQLLLVLDNLLLIEHLVDQPIHHRYLVNQLIYRLNKHFVIHSSGWVFCWASLLTFNAISSDKCASTSDIWLLNYCKIFLSELTWILYINEIINSIQTAWSTVRNVQRKHWAQNNGKNTNLKHSLVEKKWFQMLAIASVSKLKLISIIKLK